MFAQEAARKRGIQVRREDARAHEREERGVGPITRNKGGARRSWYLLQFSSSLPSGQSSNPLHWKRPMMQWTPLAQGKNVGPHLDLALAAGGKTRQTAAVRKLRFLSPGIPIPPAPSMQKGLFTFPWKSPKISYHPPQGQCRARLRALMQHPQGRGWLCLRYFQGPCTKRGSTPMCGTNE